MGCALIMVWETVLAQRQSLQDRLEGSAGSDPTDPRSALRHQDRQCRKIPASWLGDRIPRGRDANACPVRGPRIRSEEHTSELQSLMRISYAVFCLKKKTNNKIHTTPNQRTLNTQIY